MSSSLFHREVPRGPDVALAIETLVLANGELPQAISKEDVLAQLMIMQATNDEGEIVEQPAAALRYVKAAFWNTLTESTVFQSGYERYESGSNNPVVPITEYFFRYIFNDEDMRECLSSMRPIEIMQSLPKRPSVPLDADARVIRQDEGEDGEIIPAQKVGKVAGIIVFKPKDTSSSILAEWIRRKRNMVFGGFEKLTDNLEHIRGDEAAVESLRSSTRDLKRETRRLSPRGPRTSGSRE